MDTPFYNAVRSSPAMSIVKTRASHAAKVSDQYVGRPSDIAIDSLMETYNAHEGEDIRDKVYAVVGIAKYGSTIVVDYRNLVGNEYRDFFRSADSARKEFDSPASYIAVDN